jgi:hypothetical protein
MSQFNFNYQIVEILPLSELYTERFKNHRRLWVFANKGCTCVNCGIKGDTLALGIDNKGNKHWDVYNTTGETWIGLTIDHIIPRCKGGDSRLENLQPMCTVCNNKKGDNYGGFSMNVLKSDLEKNSNPSIGQELFLLKDKSRKVDYIGKCEEITVNPHYNNTPSVRIGYSYYPLTTIYTQKN